MSPLLSEGPELVDVAGEKLWEVRSTCVSCHETVHLRSEEKPGPAVFRLASCVICDACETREEALEAASNRKQRTRKLLASSKLPADLQPFYFNEMTTEGGRKFVVDACRSWAATEKPDPRGLGLFGGVGRGKTRRAATAALQRMEHGWPIRWVSMPILIAALRAAFSDKGRQEAISVLSGKGALVIDDVDKINPTEWAITQLFAAIDVRQQAGSPVLVTTNYSPSRLGEKFGEAVMSRIVSMEVIELPGRDNRMRLDETAAARDALQEPEES